jgi:small subunit ribosomal protein S18
MRYESNDRNRDRDPRRRMKRFCFFTQNNIEPDYKDIDTLRRFVTERGKILPRRLTGTSAKYQRKLCVAVKRARHLALLPFVAENLK